MMSENVRRESGLSQKAVASEFGITEIGYQNYERGRRNPSFGMLPRLARFFKVSTDYLLGLSDEPRLPDKEILDIAKRLQEAYARKLAEEKG